MQHSNLENLSYEELYKGISNALRTKHSQGLGGDEKSRSPLDKASQGILVSKKQAPDRSYFFGLPKFDLIWNYWMEEGLVMQVMNLLALRFQNHQIADNKALANFELDALRPLSHFLWSYTEAEPKRLSVLRRAYEYEHEYGLRLLGKATANMRPYERRAGFIGSFNNLVHQCHRLFRDEDDLQRRADAFPILNLLQELQKLVLEGAHNQYPDLVLQARTEALLVQFILTRPPVQEFLRYRPMVVNEEVWMGPVDCVRQAMGWDPVPVSQFWRLAESAETLMSTIRHFGWLETPDPEIARGWAQALRPEIQRYAHSYRIVTGVDLSDLSAPLPAEAASLPCYLIRDRMKALAAR